MVGRLGRSGGKVLWDRPAVRLVTKQPAPRTNPALNPRTPPRSTKWLLSGRADARRSQAHLEAVVEPSDVSGRTPTRP